MSTNIEYSKAQHQAAGHGEALVDSTGSLFIKPTTQQEVDFYTKLQELDLKGDDEEVGLDETEPTLIEFVPRFYGVLEKGINETANKSKEVHSQLTQLKPQDKQSDGKLYIVLENVLKGFKKPSIIDLKLGSILHDENSTKEKKARLEEVRRSTTSGSLHYRVCGSKIHNEDIPDLKNFTNTEGHVVKDDQGAIVFDKWVGRALTKDNILQYLSIFFTHNNLTNSQRQIVIKNTFTRIQLLYNALLSQELRIRSSSIYIAYETDTQRWNYLDDNDPLFNEDYEEDDNENDNDGNESQEGSSTSLSVLSYIDFAHAKFTPNEGHDEDLIIGVENLMNTIEKLIE